MSARRVPVAISIAGSDSGGGAGIQADLKAFARAGVHGTTAITAITVQNTVAVSAVQAVDPPIIVGQVSAVAEDLGIDAVKIGMLGDVATIEAVAQALDELPASVPIVHDPVMIAESGARLLALDAVGALRRLIVARATVITPNLAEARVLADDGDLDGIELVRALHALGPDNVVVTGGTVTAPATSSSMARRSPSCPASAIPMAPRTARAARTRRRLPRVWRWATVRSRQRATRARWRQPRSRMGCAGSGRARARSTSSALCARSEMSRGNRSYERRPFAIIARCAVSSDEARSWRGPHRGGRCRRRRGARRARRGISRATRGRHVGRRTAGRCGRTPAGADGVELRGGPAGRRPRDLLPRAAGGR